MWKEFGFAKNLYDTHPVGADKKGEKLLVGRQKELKSLRNRIENMRSTVCIEGPNGVGKTSLVLVAGYQLERETEKKQKASIILLQDPFQLSSSETAVDFKRKVYGKIASHFIEHEKSLKDRLDLQFNLKPLEAWLENPIFHQASAALAGFGGGAGRAPNQTVGFDNHGFFTIVETLLKKAFNADGGIVCILDNLEILNTSQNARELLEEMRDDILAKHGIRWVVCGARGIVKSVATSARLQGRMQEPLELQPLNQEVISDLIESRVSIFSIDKHACAPVSIPAFQHLYNVLNNNLRDALKFSGDFALWLYENDYCDKNNHNGYYELFEIWLAQQSQSYAEATQITPRAWKLFDDLCVLGGSISPSDYELFEFKSAQAMRGQISPLENHDLINSEVDETDNRRRTISVTAKGWFVRFHRRGYET
ncbi:MAG: hypothetical protein RID11_13195 [Roseovarius sp.]|jgi:hypothetical protein|uniref:P-loop NTPase fold protein n=1 Tax=Roseovarius sp. TaxID=1486281 RepID=UPI0032F01256